MRKAFNGGASGKPSRSRWGLSADGAGEQRIPQRPSKRKGLRLSAPASWVPSENPRILHWCCWIGDCDVRFLVPTAFENHRAESIKPATDFNSPKPAIIISVACF